MEINVGDIVHAEVRKADVKQEAGLKLYERDGCIYVEKADGLFKRRNIPLLPGDRIHTINGKDVEDYAGGLNEIKALIKKEITIRIAFERMEGIPSESEEEEEEQEELLMLEGPEPLLMLEGPGADESEDEEELPRLTDGQSENGDISVGLEMRLFKLSQKPKMNGTIVKVLRKAKKSGRWEVEILRHPMREVDGGSVMSVASENLKPL